MNGTTGEGLSMTVQERMEITEAWLDQKQHFEHMIMHIGAGNLRDSQTLVSWKDITMSFICISLSSHRFQ